MVVASALYRFKCRLVLMHDVILVENDVIAACGSNVE